jgi:glycosyltransferase involved in cell wall biosynthesis
VTLPVSVVMPARNAEHTLERQLDALARQRFDHPWELVVVDNGSVDGTRVLLDAWRTRLACLRVVSEPRRGANRARNAGIGAARGDRILLCDSDDVVADDWVAALSSALDDFDIAAGRLEYDTFNSHQVRDRIRTRPLSEGLATLWGRPWAVTCNLGFRRAVFDAIDGFDPSFEQGSDDVDFCFRAHAAGFTMGYSPEAVVHYQMRTEVSAHAKQHYRYARGTEQLYAKLHALRSIAEYPPRTRWNQTAYRGVRLIRDARKLLSRVDRESYIVQSAYFLGGLAGLWHYQIRGSIRSERPPQELHRADLVVAQRAIHCHGAQNDGSLTPFMSTDPAICRLRSNDDSAP